MGDGRVGDLCHLLALDDFVQYIYVEDDFTWANQT